MPWASSCEVTSAMRIAAPEVLGGNEPTPCQKTSRPTTPEPTSRTASFSLIDGIGSSGRGRLGIRHLQCVPDAVHGADQIGAELAPQRLDVAVHGAGTRR